MYRLLVITIFVPSLIHSQNLGSECLSAVKCLTEKNFTFCRIINGQAVLEDEIYSCPENYYCIDDPYEPCIKASTSTETTTTGIAPVTVPSAKKCSFGAVFPGPKHNQFYQCVRILWWYEITLQTCVLGFAFDPVKLRCVPSIV